MFICEKHYNCCDYQYWDRLEDVEQDAKECGHLIEVRPVVHGKWIEYKIPNIICCSECDFGTGTDEKSNYCPYCGADMRERK